MQYIFLILATCINILWLMIWEQSWLRDFILSGLPILEAFMLIQLMDLDNPQPSDQRWCYRLLDTSQNLNKTLILGVVGYGGCETFFPVYSFWTQIANLFQDNSWQQVSYLLWKNQSLEVINSHSSQIIHWLLFIGWLLCLDFLYPIAKSSYTGIRGCMTWLPKINL